MPKLAFMIAMASTLTLTAAAEAQDLADGQVPCSAYTEIARQLGDRYEEAPVSLGLQSNGNLLQVFASPTNGTWTIVSTAPDGFACVMAVGENWELVKAKPGHSAT
jgi:hypothetical protein